MKTSRTKLLESGKLSFNLSPKLIPFIVWAVLRRLNNEKDFLEDHTYYALEEAIRRIIAQKHKKRMSLLCSHFYAVFCPETMRYLNEDIQCVIGAYLGQIEKGSSFPKIPMVPLPSYPITADELMEIPI